MAPAKPYLLDTNVLLHWIRGKQVAENIDAQFQLRAAAFRPLICEVTLGEIEAFARGNNWGEARRNKLSELKDKISCRRYFGLEGHPQLRQLQHTRESARLGHFSRQERPLDCSGDTRERRDTYKRRRGRFLATPRWKAFGRDRTGCEDRLAIVVDVKAARSLTPLSRRRSM